MERAGWGLILWLLDWFIDCDCTVRMALGRSNCYLDGCWVWNLYLHLDRMGWDGYGIHFDGIAPLQHRSM